METTYLDEVEQIMERHANNLIADLWYYLKWFAVMGLIIKVLFVLAGVS